MIKNLSFAMVSSSYDYPVQGTIDGDDNYFPQVFQSFDGL